MPTDSAAIVINEAVELAKKFSTEDSGRYVNGVLARALAQRGAPVPQLHGGADR